MENLIGMLSGFITDNPSVTVITGSIVSFLLGSGVFSFLRRPKKVGQGEARYFTDNNLLAPPMERPAYSDRMAYVLAEMSALAYWEFEGTGGVIRDAAAGLLKDVIGNEEDAQKWLEAFADDLLVKGVDSEVFFRNLLSRSGFELLGTVNVSSTQAFVCKRVAKNEDPYIVVSYRGTEKKVEDWLTDVRAIPFEEDGTKVHTGFREELMVKMDSTGKTALQRVKKILDSEDAKDGNGKHWPLFITGHSLGGALALLTTKELACDTNGACYTFGAPRVANYEYFDNLKTPVFRIVNSADIVPRVPPGAAITLILKLMQGLSWISGFMPIVSNLFDRFEVILDKLNGYRHFGDQRYLTDVKSGRFDTVKLLSNPPAIDRMMWMGQQLRINYFTPVKSHGMAIYRAKLAYIANSRNRTGKTVSK